MAPESTGEPEDDFGGQGLVTLRWIGADDILPGYRGRKPYRWREHKGNVVQVDIRDLPGLYARYGHRSFEWVEALLPAGVQV